MLFWLLAIPGHGYWSSSAIPFHTTPLTTVRGYITRVTAISGNYNVSMSEAFFKRNLPMSLVLTSSPSTVHIPTNSLYLLEAKS